MFYDSIIENNIKELEVENSVSSTLSEIGYEEIEIFNSLDKTKVIDFNRLKNSLIRINSNLELEYIEQAIKEIKMVNYSNDDNGKIRGNIEVLNYLKNGIKIKIPNLNNDTTKDVKLIDYENINNNSFNFVRQLSIIDENSQTFRPDIIIYINGLPISIFELKRFISYDGLNGAIKQLVNYTSRCNELFWWNVVSLVSNGIYTRIGDLNSPRWFEWKQISKYGEIINDDEYEEQSKLINFKKNIYGFFDKYNILNILKNYIHYQKNTKFIPLYYQYFCTEKCVERLKDKLLKKCGYVWHTQGSGKTITMLFIAKQMMQLKISEKYKIIFISDRNDLDNQLFQTFKCSEKYLNAFPIQINSRKELKEVLSKDNDSGIYMTTIQKFNDETGVLSEKDNIIIIADEAHRSHNNIEVDQIYDDKKQEFIDKKGHAIFLREAFPNAKFLGFTGTPLKAKKTDDVFGQAVDKYTMRQAEMDKAVVPIKYEKRTFFRSLKNDDEALKILDEVYKIETESDSEYLTEARRSKIKDKLNQFYKNYNDDKTISEIVKDFWKHYNHRKESLNGKAMFVGFNREVAIRIYKEMIKQNPNFNDKIELIITSDGNKDTPEMLKLIHNEKETNEITNEFKKPSSKIKILVVVDKLLTGYDVPDLDTIYIFKVIKWHNLMQTVARVNRIFPNKEYGLVVDYIGIASYLEQALTEYGGLSKEEGKIFNLESIKTKLVDSLLEIRKEHYLINNIYNEWMKSIDSDSKIKSIENSVEYIGSLELEARDKFFKKVSKINKWYKICRQLLSHEEKKEYQLYHFTLSLIRKNNVEDSIDLTETLNKLKSMIVDLVEVGNIDFELVPINKLNSLMDLAKWIENKKIDKVRLNSEIDKIKIIEETKEQIKRFREINPLDSQKLSDSLKKLIDQLNSKLISMSEFLDEVQKFLDIMIEQEKNGEKLENKWLTPIFNILCKPEFREKLNKNTDNDLIELVYKIESIFSKHMNEHWLENSQIRDQACYELMTMLYNDYNYPPGNVEEDSYLIVDEISQNITIIKKISEKKGK